MKHYTPFTTLPSLGIIVLDDFGSIGMRNMGNTMSITIDQDNKHQPEYICFGLLDRKMSTRRTCKTLQNAETIYREKRSGSLPRVVLTGYLLGMDVSVDPSDRLVLGTACSGELPKCNRCRALLVIIEGLDCCLRDTIWKRGSVGTVSIAWEFHNRLRFHDQIAGPEDITPRC